MLSMHLRQLFRKPIRTISYILMLVLLSAFFCMSLNLYNDSQCNLQLADNAYTTILYEMFKAVSVYTYWNPMLTPLFYDII